WAGLTWPRRCRGSTSARQVDAVTVLAPPPWVLSPELVPCVAVRSRDVLRADAGQPTRRPRDRSRPARPGARVPALRQALPLAPAIRQPRPPCSACAGVTGQPARALNTSRRSPAIGSAGTWAQSNDRRRFPLRRGSASTIILC